MPRGAQPAVQGSLPSIAAANPPSDVRTNMRRADLGTATGAFASGAYRKSSAAATTLNESDAEDDEEDDQREQELRGRDRGRGRGTGMTVTSNGDTVGALPSEVRSVSRGSPSQPSSITPQGGGARARNASRTRSSDGVDSVSRSRSRSSSRPAAAAAAGGAPPKERGESLSSRLSFGFGRRVSRSESNDQSSTRGTADGESIISASTMATATKDKNQERGREPYASTGRGGVGNAVRSPSRGRPAQDKAEHDATLAYHNKQNPSHSGRGGAGNVRSPSRDPAQKLKDKESEKQEHVLQHEALRHDAQHTGRGGVGNIKSEHGHSHSQERGRESHHGGVAGAIRSMSRSRSREPRSSSGQRSHVGEGEQKLDAVDETSSGASTTNGKGEHHGLVNKIASHLPGHH